MGVTKGAGGGKGHQQLMVCMEKKYVGLHLDEKENDWMMCRINRVEMTGCCQKHFELRGVTMKYDDTKPKNHPDNRDKHEYWVLNNETLACIAEYFKNDPGRDGVQFYWPEDDCDSEDPGDEWEWVGTGKEGLLRQGKKSGLWGGKIIREYMRGCCDGCH
jgi:hypothetical protein